MNVQLTTELINIAAKDGTLNKITWDNGITNLAHLNNMAGYGVVIDQQILEYVSNPDTPAILDSELGYPPAIFRKLNKYKFSIEQTNITFEVTGDYFTPATQITSDVLNINGVEYLDLHTLVVSADTLGIAVNPRGTLSIDGVVVTSLQTVVSTWIDFRLGGDPVSDFDLAAVTEKTLIRDADGIGTTNSGDAWQKLIGIKDYALSRDHDAGFQLIYKKQTSRPCMFGLIASDHGVDSSMHNETHVGIYCNTQNNHWGFYSYAVAKNLRSIDAYDRLKLVFNSTTTPGSQYSLYGLKPGDEWDDGEFIYTATTPGGTQDAGDIIYPCLIPQTGISARLQAFNPCS